MTIRNDQYLHRLNAGRGAIKPDDPLEVRLYGPDGKPIGVQDDALKVALSGSTVDMATETTLAQAVDKLNSILSRLESKLDTAIFDSQGNPISAANRLPVEATLSGSVTLGQRYEIETIHDAVTLAPGEMTPEVMIPVKGANILFLAINVSASGWSLFYNHSAPFGVGTANVSVFGYPQYVNATVFAQFTSFPILVLPLLTLETFRQHNQPPETWEEALLFRSVQSTRPRIRNDRESGDITVTLRAFRIWR